MLLISDCHVQVLIWLPLAAEPGTTCSSGAPRNSAKNFSGNFIAVSSVCPKATEQPQHSTQRGKCCSLKPQREYYITQEGLSKPSCKINKNKAGSQGKAATKPLLLEPLGTGSASSQFPAFPSPLAFTQHFSRELAAGTQPSRAISWLTQFCSQGIWKLFPNREFCILCSPGHIPPSLVLESMWEGDPSSSVHRFWSIFRPGEKKPPQLLIRSAIMKQYIYM